MDIIWLTRIQYLTADCKSSPNCDTDALRRIEQTHCSSRLMSSGCQQYVAILDAIRRSERRYRREDWAKEHKRGKNAPLRKDLTLCTLMAKMLISP